MIRNRLLWIVMEIKWVIIRCAHVITQKRYISNKEYSGSKLYSINESAEIIGKLICGSKPFAVCRTSYVEFGFLVNEKRRELFGIDVNGLKRKKDYLLMIAGTGDKLTRNSNVKRFTDLWESAIGLADVIAVWSDMIMCDTYLKMIKSGSPRKYAHAVALEPYACLKPWSRCLKGKKVVTVSPFSKEIEYQYARRELIWDDPDILPEFDLITVDSVWYYGDSRDERFSSWFDALDYLFDEVMKQDFDIALLGCGPFGFPLASQIKKAGKQAIHIGGALQILFGIKGKRWDNTGLYNEYWIRPQNKPSESVTKKLDDGCYW